MGRAHAVRARRAPGPSGSTCTSKTGSTSGDVERWVAVRVGAALQRRRDRHRRRATGGSSACAAARATGSTTAGSIRRTCTAGRPTTRADRLTRPLVREGGRLVETRLGRRRWAGSSSARKALLAEPGGWGRIGFYTTGQLFLEEYYTLAVIGKAGIGTPHMDGNTRLCTATAAAALKASFGSDGQPGSYTDVDHCDAIALYGHNVAETQAVLWMRMLDRRRGADPPRMLCVDPRETPVAREADVHLAPRARARTSR